MVVGDVVVEVVAPRCSCIFLCFHQDLRCGCGTAGLMGPSSPGSTCTSSYSSSIGGWVASSLALGCSCRLAVCPPFSHGFRLGCGGDVGLCSPFAALYVSLSLMLGLVRPATSLPPKPSCPFLSSFRFSRSSCLTFSLCASSSMSRVGELADGFSHGLAPLSLVLVASASDSLVTPQSGLSRSSVSPSSICSSR